MVKSYVKLYGPSIFEGQEALEKMIKGITSPFQVGEMIKHMVSMLDPSFDLKTGDLLGVGEFILGEYDFAVEWKSSPTKDHVKALIRRIDSALAFTGCRYTITTKKD